MSGYTWDLDSNGGGGDKVEFTKFPEGITRLRVVDEAPYVRWTHFLRQFKRSVNCPGKGCPICDIRRKQKANGQPYTYAMARRFTMNVINRETGKVEIMEQGMNFMEDLKLIREDLVAEGKSLLDADIKVRRTGTTKDNTRYRVDMDTVTPLTEEEENMVIKSKVDFTDYFKPHTVEQITRIVNGEPWDEVMKTEKPAEDGNIGEEEEIELS